MKKTIIALALGVFAVSAQAERFYVQAEAGASNLNLSDELNSDLAKGNVATQRLTFGIDKGSQRYALDVTNFGKLESNSKIQNVDVDVDVEAKVLSVGLSFTQHLREGDFVPYLGGRVSYTKADVKANVGTNSSFLANTIKAEDKSSSFGYGAFVGAEYRFTSNFAVNIDAEYNQLSSDLRQVGGKAGVRYSF